MKAASLELLEKQLPPAQARAILQAMDAEFSARESTVATKRDLELAKLDLERGLHELRDELRGEIRDLRHELELKLEGFESRLTRWNFAFWIGQGVALGALIRFVK